MQRPAQAARPLEGRERRRPVVEHLVAVGEHRPAPRLHQRVAGRAAIAGRTALRQHHPEPVPEMGEERERERERRQTLRAETRRAGALRPLSPASSAANPVRSPWCTHQGRASLRAVRALARAPRRSSQ